MVLRARATEAAVPGAVGEEQREVVLALPLGRGEDRTVRTARRRARRAAECIARDAFEVPSGAVEGAPKWRAAVGTCLVDLTQHVRLVAGAPRGVQRIDAQALVRVVEHLIAEANVGCLCDRRAQRSFRRILARAVIREPVGEVLQLLGVGAVKRVVVAHAAVVAQNATGIGRRRVVDDHLHALIEGTRHSARSRCRGPIVGHVDRVADVLSAVSLRRACRRKIERRPRVHRRQVTVCRTTARARVVDRAHQVVRIERRLHRIDVLEHLVVAVQTDPRAVLNLRVVVDGAVARVARAPHTEVIAVEYRIVVQRLLCRQDAGVAVDVRRCAINIVVVARASANVRRFRGRVVYPNDPRGFVGHDAPVHRSRVVHRDQHVGFRGDRVLQRHIGELEIELHLTGRRCRRRRRNGRNVDRHGDVRRYVAGAVPVANLERVRLLAGIVAIGRIGRVIERSVRGQREADGPWREAHLLDGDRLAVDVDRERRETPLGLNAQERALLHVVFGRRDRDRIIGHHCYRDVDPRGILVTHRIGDRVLEPVRAVVVRLGRVGDRRSSVHLQRTVGERHRRAGFVQDCRRRGLGAFRIVDAVDGPRDAGDRDARRR